MLIHNKLFITLKIQVCENSHSQWQSSQLKLYFIGIPDLEFQPNSTIRLSIPYDSACGTDHLYFVWPKMLDYDGNDCFCLPLRRNYDFDSCVERCKTEYDVHREGDSIIFRNLTSSTNQVLVHFICEKDPCAGDSCITVSVAASYRISLIGKNNKTTIIRNPLPFMRYLSI